MPTISKATLTVTSSYTAATASTLSAQTWGYITLWDIRPWLPWESRGQVGITGWQGYLIRTAVFDSTQAPLYSPGPQGPKGWEKRTDSVLIYDATAPHTGNYPYTACSVYGSGPYTYTPDSISSATAFDGTSISNLIDTLVVAAYAFNSFPPALGGPTATDELEFFGCYLDVLFDDASTTRFYPQSTFVVDPGVGVGSPTGVLNPEDAVDTDRTNTPATIQETNGHVGGTGALWHPALLLIEGWSWGTVECNHPPDGIVGVSYSHSMTVTGGTAPYTWSVTAGSLPPGLSLNGATGAVTGTPTVDAVFNFTVSVVDSSGIPISVACSIRIANFHYLLDLWVWRVLGHVDSADQALAFPPGYERALRLQLAAEFGRQYPGHDLSKIKTQLKAAILSIDQSNVANSQAVEDLPPPPPAQPR